MNGCVPEWAESGRCGVFACNERHGSKFCGVCGEFPCAELTDMIHRNKDIIAYMRSLAEEYKEALNKSRHASYLHIFRLIARKLLEIHQVFLRHFRAILWAASACEKSVCVICIPDLISTSIKLSLKKSVRMPTFLLFNVKLNKKHGF